MSWHKILNWLLPLGVGALFGLLALRTIADLVAFAAVHTPIYVVRFADR